MERRRPGTGDRMMPGSGASVPSSSSMSPSPGGSGGASQPEARRGRGFESVAGRLLGNSRGSRGAAPTAASTAAASPSSASGTPKRSTASAAVAAPRAAAGDQQATSQQHRRRLRDGGAAVLSSASGSGRCSPGRQSAEAITVDAGAPRSSAGAAKPSSATPTTASGSTSASSSSTFTRPGGSGPPVASSGASAPSRLSLGRGGAFRFSFGQQEQNSPNSADGHGRSSASSSAGNAVTAIRSLRRAEQELEEELAAVGDRGDGASASTAASFRPSVANLLARQARRRAEGGQLAEPTGGQDTPSAEASSGIETHFGVSCDGCGAGPPLIGQVMKCSDCEDFDYCMSCYRDRSRLRHPRSHRFHPRTPPEGVPRLGGGGGGLVAVLMHLMEEQMLREALLASAGGDDHSSSAEPQEDPEVLAAEALSRLRRLKWKSPGNCADAEECALCLEEYKRGEEVLQLNCSHVFHEACLGPWLVKSLVCPMCKADV